MRTDEIEQLDWLLRVAYEEGKNTMNFSQRDAFLHAIRFLQYLPVDANDSHIDAVFDSIVEDRRDFESRLP